MCRMKEGAEMVCSPEPCVIQGTGISIVEEETNLIRVWKLNLMPASPEESTCDTSLLLQLETAARWDTIMFYASYKFWAENV